MEIDAIAVFHFDAALACLICKVHGHAVHPTATAITRHLRGKGHHESGARLKCILAWCMQLPLCPEPNHVWSSTRQLTPPQYLRRVEGYGCNLCSEEFLTTSLELMRKHIARHHRPCLQAEPWQRCKLLTLFKETKNRHYRRAGTRAEPLQLPCLENDHIIIHGAGASPRYSMCDRHPMAMIASQHVRSVSVSTLDSMFKSPAFCTISRPLFTAGRIEADNAMFTVFPGSESDPLFFQALVYALIRVSPANVVSMTQYLSLEKMLVQQLNERIEAFQKVRHITIPTIGALLLLKVAAYKVQDTNQHQIHTSGVKAALGVSDHAALSEPLRRGIFWQDLYAAIFVESQREFSDFMAYECFDSLPIEPLPIGFSRAKSLLGQDLCACIVDTIKFDKLRRELLQETWSGRYRRLDGLQASIESRLQAMTALCRRRSHVAETVRLATLFWCYCSWMEIWNDPLVPCEILKQMLDVLQESLETIDSLSLWQNHMGLLCWLLLMVTDVIGIGNESTHQIAQKHQVARQLANNLLVTASIDQLKAIDQCAELDFGPNFPWRRESGEVPLFT